MEFPPYGWEDAIRNSHRAAWCDYLKQAGMQEEMRRYRGLKRSDNPKRHPKPNQAQFDRWMAENIKGLNVDELPPEIADKLLRGLIGV